MEIRSAETNRLDIGNVPIRSLLRRTRRVVLRGRAEARGPKPRLDLCDPWMSLTTRPREGPRLAGPGSWGGSERPAAPVSEVASLRDTTPFVMWGGGYEGAQSRPVWCPEADTLP